MEVEEELQHYTALLQMRIVVQRGKHVHQRPRREKFIHCLSIYTPCEDYYIQEKHNDGIELDLVAIVWSQIG
jgi:hypothetical protein